MHIAASLAPEGIVLGKTTHSQVPRAWIDAPVNQSPLLKWAVEKHTSEILCGIFEYSPWNGIDNCTLYFDNINDSLGNNHIFTWGLT